MRVTFHWFVKAMQSGLELSLIIWLHMNSEDESTMKGSKDSASVTALAESVMFLNQLIEVVEDELPEKAPMWRRPLPPPFAPMTRFALGALLK